MAKPTKKQAAQFEALILELEPGVRAAFLAAIDDLGDGIDWARFLSALAAGETEKAIEALNLSPQAYYDFSKAVEGAYAAGGALTASTIRAGEGTIGFRFNMQNPAAEAWVAQNVGLEIVRISSETVDIVRDIIKQGYAKGEHPFTIALDIAGRVGPKGVRAGGVLGLDRPRADRYLKVTQGMRTASGVQDLVNMGPQGPYVRYKVNKATEQRILAAYSKGTAVSEAERLLSAKQYYNALLKARADTIARTETGQAVMSSRFAAWEQAAEAKGMETSNIIKTWRHGSSSKYKRPEHVDMNGVSVRGLYTPFVFPDDVFKQHALDGVGGGRHDINCGCSTDFRLDRSVGLQ